MSFALFGSCLIAERNDESGSGKQDKEWLFNKSETRAVFSRVLFLNPQVLSITSSVRLSIMIMEKFPSSILIVALNVFAIQLDNQQFYRHVLADELRNEPALLILDFLRNSLVRHNTVQYNDDVVENQHLVQVPFRRIRR
jgi:hypothetical protein